MSGFLISFVGSTVDNGTAVPQSVNATNPLPVTIISGGGGGGGATAVALGTLAVVAGTGKPQAIDLFSSTSVQLKDAGGGAVAGTSAAPSAAILSAQGNVASAVTDTGNPVKVGGIANSTRPTFTAGQRANFQTTLNGEVIVAIGGGSATTVIAGNTVNGDGVSSGTRSLSVQSFGYLFNNVGWDRNIKPRTSYKVPASLATNNAANIKASAGNVHSFSCFNTGAVVIWLKFFDTAVAPNPAALAQYDLFPLAVGFNRFDFSTPNYFPTGIGVAMVANAADLDNTAIAAGAIAGLNVRFS